MRSCRSGKSSHPCPRSASWPLGLVCVSGILRKTAPYTGTICCLRFSLRIVFLPKRETSVGKITEASALGSTSRILETAAFSGYIPTFRPLFILRALLHLCLNCELLSRYLRSTEWEASIHLLTHGGGKRELTEGQLPDAGGQFRGVTSVCFPTFGRTSGVSSGPDCGWCTHVPCSGSAALTTGPPGRPYGSS